MQPVTNDQQATVNDAQAHQYTEEELDRLQAKWVIGKQRGKDKLLRTDELLWLLRSGRLRWDVLTLGEQRSVKNYLKTRGEVGDWTQKVSVCKAAVVEGQLIFEQKKIDVVAKSVRLLLLEIDKCFPKITGSEEWRELAPKLRDEARKILFKIKYGSYPDFFAFELYKSIVR